MKLGKIGTKENSKIINSYNTIINQSSESKKN